MVVPISNRLRTDNFIRSGANTGAYNSDCASRLSKCYSALAMAATRANFDKSWDIFADVATNPSFTKEDVDLVKTRLVASLSDDTDEPDTYLQRLQEKVAYAGHPYLNRPEGTAETISKLTAEDLRAYHKGIMQTSRLLLVIVGDLDAAQLKPRIAAKIGRAHV